MYMANEVTLFQVKVQSYGVVNCWFTASQRVAKLYQLFKPRI